MMETIPLTSTDTPSTQPTKRGFTVKVVRGAQPVDMEAWMKRYAEIVAASLSTQDRQSEDHAA